MTDFSHPNQVSVRALFEYVEELESITQSYFTYARTGMEYWGMIVSGGRDCR